MTIPSGCPDLDIANKEITAGWKNITKKYISSRGYFGTAIISDEFIEDMEANKEIHGNDKIYTYPDQNPPFADYERNSLELNIALMVKNAIDKLEIIDDAWSTPNPNDPGGFSKDSGGNLISYIANCGCYWHPLHLQYEWSCPSVTVPSGAGYQPERYVTTYIIDENIYDVCHLIANWYAVNVLPNEFDQTTFKQQLLAYRELGVENESRDTYDLGLVFDYQKCQSYYGGCDIGMNCDESSLPSGESFASGATGGKIWRWYNIVYTFDAHYDLVRQVYIKRGFSGNTDLGSPNTSIEADNFQDMNNFYNSLN